MFHFYKIGNFPCVFDIIPLTCWNTVVVSSVDWIGSSEDRSWFHIQNFSMSLHAFQQHLSRSKLDIIVLNTYYGTLMQRLIVKYIPIMWYKHVMALLWCSVWSWNTFQSCDKHMLWHSDAMFDRQLHPNHVINTCYGTLMQCLIVK